MKIIEEETGTPSKKMHEIFKHFIFKDWFKALETEEEIEYDSIRYVVPKHISTANLTNKQFIELFEKVIDLQRRMYEVELKSKKHDSQRAHHKR